MKELNRKAVGKFTQEEGIAFEMFEKMDKEQIQERLIKPEEILGDYPKCILSEKLFLLFVNGVCLQANELGREELEDGFYCIYGKNGFLGIGKVEKNRLKREWLEKESID